MTSPSDAAEIAAAAISSASDFLAALRNFTSAGFDAIDEAINQIVTMADDEVSDEVRSTAVSALTITLGHVELG